MERYVAFLSLLLLALNVSTVAARHAQGRCEQLAKLFALHRDSAADIARAAARPTDFLDLTEPALRLNPKAGRPGSGTHNYGVFRVRLSSGRWVALKLVDGSALGYAPDRTDPAPSKELIDYVAIHSAFGIIDEAPAFHGYLMENELAPILRALRAQGNKIPTNRPIIGTIMEEVPEAWNFFFEAVTPSYVAQWSVDTVTGLLEQMCVFREELAAAGVKTRDFQFFVTPSPTNDRKPRLLLGDLDDCRFYRNEPVRKVNVSGDMKALIKGWERATGKKYPDAMLQKMLANSSS
jgi:hypothetical protein